MKSLKHLFRIGRGPSSSHTIAPFNASLSFRRLADGLSYDRIKATLYGSFALTGVGHGTDQVIKEALAGHPIEFVFDTKTMPRHPNEMTLEAYQGDKLVLQKTYDSLGGGEIFSPDDESVNEYDIYPFRNFEEIKCYMKKHHIDDIKDFCRQYEDPDIDEYLDTCLDVMFESVEEGLKKTGKIISNGNPRLNVSRVAKDIYKEAFDMKDETSKDKLLITAFAYAVSEGNACHERIVTAPTCGASGILPSILYYEYHFRNVDRSRLRDSLYIAGTFGNIVKQNASIAGAIGGCQAEVGTATSMAAACLCYLDSLSVYQMEYAAEVAMEHFLGLSCDPVDGYVIIPCIERNGVGALRAYDSYLYAKYIAPIKKNQVSFDNVVSAMKLTGDALLDAYKETAIGGLASILKEKCK